MPDNSFVKFMCDIVRSGVWKRLTPSARALYPALLIHSDGNFKPVHPSIRRLKQLTGLSNNGISSGLRSLEKEGLIRIWSGKHKEGNRNNIYEFVFDYEGCDVELSFSEDKAKLIKRQASPSQKSRVPSQSSTDLPPTRVSPTPSQEQNEKRETEPITRQLLRSISRLISLGEIHYAKDTTSGTTFSVNTTNDPSVLVLRDRKNNYRVVAHPDELARYEFY